MGEPGEPWRPDNLRGAAGMRPPEIPRDPMEFLSRSWSVSALEVSKTIAPNLALPPPNETMMIPEDTAGEAADDSPAAVAGNPFSFASSATSQLIMERIMSQSLQEMSPLTSGRLSHSSGPLNGGQSGGSLTDSPTTLSPSELEEASKYCRASNPPKPQYGRGANAGGGGRRVGRWLKDRRERKKEEARAHNAQLHAAVSVAGVAAAVATVAAATASASSASGRDDRAARADMAVASAATLVAAQCVENAESLGAERDHLAAVVGSAVNVRTPGDIVTLTAAAATALRGAATLKARVLKEVWNIAAVIPVEKGSSLSSDPHQMSHHHHDQHPQQQHTKSSSSNADEFVPDENFLSLCSQELLARGTELLKRTRKGALHWKAVSVYINRMGVVMLKMKSRHVAGTITKKKKSAVCEVCRDIPAWPGRHLLENGEQRRYFGLKTAEHRVIEFECRSQREYEMWTQGVARLLTIAGEKKRLS